MSPIRTRTLAVQCARRNGAALVVALICVLLVSMMSAVLVRAALAQREQLERDAWQLQADWLAQSALERAIARTQSDPAYAGETWLPPGATGTEVIGRVEIAIASSPGDGQPASRVVRISVNVPDDPVNRVHVAREVPLPEGDSSITADAPSVNE